MSNVFLRSEAHVSEQRQEKWCWNQYEYLWLILQLLHTVRKKTLDQTVAFRIPQCLSLRWQIQRYLCFVAIFKGTTAGVLVLYISTVLTMTFTPHHQEVFGGVTHARAPPQCSAVCPLAIKQEKVCFYYDARIRYTVPHASLCNFRLWHLHAHTCPSCGSSEYYTLPEWCWRTSLISCTFHL